jgi:Uma2 family endonuclease
MRDAWYPLPNVCIYELPAPEERFPSRPPLLWIEILSEDDRMIEVWEKANDLIALGTPYVWIINPRTLDSELRISSGIVPRGESNASFAGLARPDSAGGCDRRIITTPVTRSRRPIRT